MGYLYRPKLKNPNAPEEWKGLRCKHESHGREDTCPGCGGRFGKVWWIEYYVNGKAVRESTETEKETEGRRFLKVKEGRAASGLPMPPRVDRILYDPLAADLRHHYRMTGKRNLIEVEDRLAHLDRFFQGRRAASITGADLTEYAAKRQAEKTNREQPPSSRTINIELALLRRMFRLANENGTPLPVPPISKKMLKEAPPRQGFFERDVYEAVRR